MRNAIAFHNHAWNVSALFRFEWMARFALTYHKHLFVSVLNGFPRNCFAVFLPVVKQFVSDIEYLFVLSIVEINKTKRGNLKKAKKLRFLKSLVREMQRWYCVLRQYLLSASDCMNALLSFALLCFFLHFEIYRADFFHLSAHI